MGQVLPLTLHLHEYPTATAALGAAESVFLDALRCWVAGMRQGSDPLVQLREHMTRAGVPDAANSVDYLMQVIARTARWQVDIRCAQCPYLSRDERRLLHAAALAQAGEVGRAEEVLRAGMLSTLGAEFAIGPLEGLGELLIGAGLVFPRRAPEVGRHPADAVFEAWAPTLPVTSVH
ncbi:hypothetical protein [Roseicella aerolata]|uniref:Uncharacterized protein n=1 Tax=Roseicella aerolata TaxID=2883479 RepID=A0A9X1LDV5_9PROT|nr:hypothetical protein [Roseicella aerolata]MCB4825382.1 hypothetical protein [Roseicella aerolata]